MALEAADEESRSVTSKQACRISVSWFVSIGYDTNLAELLCESELIHAQ